MKWLKAIEKLNLAYFGRGLSTLLGVGLYASSALANPVVDHIAAGQVSIQQTQSNTRVNQASQQAIINWRSFNIGRGEATHFQQPGGGIILNRINPSAGVSGIYGRLTATGQIILVNPAGIYFGPSAFVNVGGMIASTGKITDQDFLNRYYHFTSAGPLYSGSIINEGQIIAARHGLIALLGQGVENNGTIRANLGHVVLASGDAFTMNFNGNDLISFSVDSKAMRAGVDQYGKPLKNGVSNTGRITANGGSVFITAQAAKGVLDNVINLQGITEANSVTLKNGEVVLGNVTLAGDTDAGTMNVAGNINASGTQVGQTGGNITITGHNIFINSPMTINVSGDRGGGNINIGGGAHGEGSLPHANAVIITPSVNLIADALSSGNGGNVVVWSNDFTGAHGTISAQGGTTSGNGGFIETSSHHLLDINAIIINTNAVSGTKGLWLLDPSDVTIQANGGTNNNISFSSNTYTPTTGASTSIIDVSNLEINLASTNVDITTASTGTGQGNITVNAPISWSSANTLTLTAENNIYLNADITALNGGLNLRAANNSQSITSGTPGTPSLEGVTAAISVNNFNLLQGQWYQVNSALPIFSVTRNFQIASGSITPTLVQFLRAQGGTGISASPYRVTDIYGLQGIGSSATLRTRSFTLINNISASGTVNWNAGAGFVPIGSSTANFTGQLDGGNFSLNQLRISRASLTGVGLMGFVSGTGTISNINLTNATISGGNSVGILAGQIGTTVNITNTQVSGSVQGTNDTGGLIGLNLGGMITGSSSSTTITANASALRTGGLVGQNRGTVANSNSSSVISGFGPNGFTIGGLIGLNTGTLQDSFSSSNLTVSNYSNVGGLIGSNSSTGNILRSYSVGKVASSNSFSVGGLVGLNNGSITNAYSSSSLDSIVSNGIAYGGLVGLNQGGSISNAFSTGLINVSNITHVGGLVGRNTGGTIQNAYSTATINASNSSSIGGLVGVNESNSIISNAYNIGLVSASNSTNVGGFAGVNQSGAIINTSFWDTDTSGQSSGTGSNSSTLNYLTGGCFTGNCLSTINLSNQSTYTTAPYAWNFTTTWGITTGSSYPWLRSFYSTTPTAISGNTPVKAAQVNLAVNGTVYDTTYTGANGFFYFLEGNNLVSGINHTISGGSPLLIYINSGDTLGNVVALSAGNSLSDLTITTNIVQVGQNNTDSILSTALLSAAKGSIINSNILYSIIDNNLILTSGKSLNVTAPTSYILNGNITTTNGNIVFNGGGLGALTLSANANITTTTTGNIQIGQNITGGNNTLTLNTIGLSNTLTGVVSNLSSLVKNGTGTLSIGAANTYDGSTLINAGTLIANHANALGSSTGSTSVASGATLTINNVAMGAESISINGFGVGNVGALTGTGTASLAGNLTLAGTNYIGGSGTLTLNGIISGNGIGFTKVGSGTLILSGANTYTGGTVINSGTLQLGLNNAISSSTYLNVTSGATFNQNNFSTSIAQLLGSGSVTLGSGTLTTGNSGNFTFSGIISGTGNLVKQGIGIFTLSQNNTYSGTTSISAGTLQMDINNALSTSSNVNIASTGVLSLNNYDTSIGSLAGSGSVTLGSGTLSLNNNTSTTYSGVVSGTGGLTKNGSGVFTLSGSNTYVGVTNLNSGTLQANNATNAFGTGILNLNGGTLQAATAATLGNSAFNVTASSTINSTHNLAITNGGVLSSGAVLTVSSPVSVALNGVLSGAGGITQNGADGILTLSGANTYSGTTTLTAGTLQANNSTHPFGTGILNLNGGTLQALTATTLNNSAFNLTNSSTINGTNNLTITNGGDLSNGILTVANTAGIVAINGDLHHIGGITQNGIGGTLRLSGANTYSGSTTLTAGTLQANNANAINPFGSGTLNLNGGTLQALTSTILENINVNVTASSTINGTNNISILNGGTLSNGAMLTIANTAGNVALNGVLSGAGGITQNGAGGTLTLSGVNTYTGATTLTAGTLQANSATNPFGTGVFNLNGGTLQALTATTFNNTTFNILAPSILNGANDMTVTNGGALNALLTVANTAGTITLNGSFNGSGGIYQTGAGGALVLNGSNNYTGDTNLNGIVEITNTLNPFGIGVLNLNNVTLQVATATTLGNSTFNILTSSTINGTHDLFITNGGVLNSGALLTLANNAGTITFNGALSGAGGIIQNGAGGTVLLSGTNTYSGGTTLTAGTLQVNNATNALGTGILILNGGTLQAVSSSTLGNSAFNVTTSSTIDGIHHLTIANGGVLSNGAILTIGNTAGIIALNGVLSGAGGITQNGLGGTLTLSGANTYTGTTNLNAGTLQANHATNPFGTGVLNLNGGALVALTNTTLDNNTFAVASGSAVTIAGANNLTFTNSGALANTSNLIVTNTGTTTFNGLSGNGALTQNNNTGVVNLGGVNTNLTGAINLTSGTLQITNNNLNPLGTGNLNLNGGTLLATVATTVNPITNNYFVGDNTSIGGNQNMTFTGNGTLNNGTLTNINTATTRLDGNLSGTGNLNEQAGILVLAGNNSAFTGNLILSGGTLSIANAQSIGVSAVTINSGSTFDINGITLNNDFTLNGGNLSATGNALLNGYITLISGTNSSLIANTGSTLTIGNQIEGNGSLLLQGAGDVIIQNTIGANIALNSLIVDANLTLNGGFIQTTNDQIYHTPLTLVTNTTLQSNAGNITLDAAINGAFDLAINSAGTITLSGAVGTTTPLTDLSIAGVAIQLNSNTVTTTGNQNYSGLVTLGNDTLLTTTGAGANSITFNNGINGNKNLTLNSGTSGSHTFGINGPLALNMLNVTAAPGATNNSFLYNNPSNQTWTLNGTNLGSVTGVSGVSATYFDNIQNLTGGSGSNHFILNGNTLSGNINGGAGNNNTLIANNSVNTWNINSANAGTVTGVGGEFNQIQNLTGGTSNNTFIFANNAYVDGLIDGGVLSSTNTLNYTAYASPLTALLNTLNAGSLQGQRQVAAFTNINNLLANNNLNNTLTLPTTAPNTITVTSAREGYIDNPMNFNGLQSIRSLTGNDRVVFNVPAVYNPATGIVTINGVTMSFINFAASSFSGDITILQPNPNPPTPIIPTSFFDSIIPAILQQPLVNAENDDATPMYSVETNLYDYLQQQDDAYKKLLYSTRIVIESTLPPQVLLKKIELFKKNTYSANSNF